MASAVRSPTLALAGVYRRRVAASLARIWENVYDWEHLPGLHGATFHAVELLERGRAGWRIRLVSQPGDVSRAQILELQVDKRRHRYRVVTRQGAGLGSEIRVQLTPHAPHETGVEVEFHVPEAAAERLAATGRRYVEIYTRLWDEDEGMMIARERACARRPRRRTSPPRAKRLGALAELRARLPLVVSFAGERFRVVELDGDLVAHAATCPHWRGPLDEAPVVDGCVRCPWHGYSFDVRSGASADGRRLRLPIAPQVTIERDQVMLRSVDP